MGMGGLHQVSHNEEKEIIIFFNIKIKIEFKIKFHKKKKFIHYSVKSGRFFFFSCFSKKLSKIKELKVDRNFQ